MRFQGTVVEEDDYNFGVVVVQESTIRVPSQASTMQQFGTQVFGDIPVVLMAKGSDGKPSYFGRQDLVDYLSKSDSGSLELMWFDI